MGNELIKHLDF